MALVSLPGDGLWIPSMPLGILAANNSRTLSDTMLLDADLEEAQFIGSVKIDGGGSKTFGTSGSALDWLPGASITFTTGATLRVGVKKASSISTSSGPVGRATTGTAAFDVYRDLVGGTDTITSTTWRSDAMNTGTPYTVTDGDDIALCFCLTPAGGAPSVKIRCATDSGIIMYPVHVLVTASGATFTGQSVLSNIIITFDDGTLGWIQPSSIFSVVDAATSAIGNTNIIGNIFNLPYTVEIDAISAAITPTTNAANWAFDLYSTPLGTPSLVTSVAFDANTTGSTSVRMAFRELPTKQTLNANTDYAIGIRQTTATSVTSLQYDVSGSTHFKPNGLSEKTYGVTSTAGATFADALATKRRRYLVWAHVSAIDIPAGGSTPHIIGG
jgi:hypothetical protein